jgi:hypothetical protein
MPGLSREAVDRGVLEGTPLVEAPGGHTRAAMLVPREELGLATRLAAASHAKHQAPLVRRGTIDPSAVRALGKTICGALDEGPMPSADLRAAVAASHPRSLDLFAAALAQLTLEGKVRRFPIAGRIDSPKYLYELMHPDDRPDLAAEGDAASVHARLASVFLRRHGPATIEDFAWWTGSTKTDARAALTTIGAASIAVDGWTSQAWLNANDVDAWNRFKDPGDPRVQLLPFRDPFVYVRRPVAVLASDPAAPVLDWKAKKIPVSNADSLHHHAIVANGTLVGVWEYDADEEAIVTRVWGNARGLASQVKAAAAETARFIREQIGDMKFYAADTPTSRAPRVTFISAARRASG